MPNPTALWTDIKTGNWIDRYLPVFTRTYARLMRVDRPIGTWLLLLPCWWGVALASPHLPDLWLMILFAIGALVMRGAGCVVNDIYDRRLDAMVERTRTRPLASGQIKLWQAVFFLGILLCLGLLVLLLFNGFTVAVGIASLLLVFAYPAMKRITWWPQLFLGFTFNWGALMGWSAVTGGLNTASLLIYAAGVFWTLGYDTIYAHQDKRDDELIGIKSTARLFADNSRPWVTLFYALCLGFLALAGLVVGLGQAFYIALLIAGGFIAIQLAVWNMNSPEDCLLRFHTNRDFGLIILAGIIFGKLT